ncbi:O-antigen ligase family protein [Phenylobacterium sp.]|uniref:O-antigen ligase family protein n=1 Tax=Phenylobacterium sp. TaxID=1871053 RepID=UPI0028111B9B|nr:O-antigen ligase family protein [Phenylobacterium sp.]
MKSRFPSLRTGPWDPALVAATLLIVVSIALGGASRQHIVRLALVEIAALPLLVIACARLIDSGAWRGHRFAVLLVAGVVAIPLIQLVPLPPAVWTGLPGRDQLVLALDLAGLEPGWTTLSLTPDRTGRSGLALIPPVAMFLGLIAAPHLARRLVALYLAAAVISMLLGAAQLASGGESLYPWETTSAGSVNGFFANGNHLAAYLLVMLPFAMALGAGSLRRAESRSLSLWLAAIFIGMVVIVLAAIRSRAGIILFVPVMLFSLLGAWFATGRRRPGVPFLLLIGAAGAGATAVATLSLQSILSRFSESASEGRLDRWPTVAQAAQDNLPLGTGVGSFDPVYRSVEPLAQLDSTFFNQAHNEYLEIWLETGWLGPALFIAFLVWGFRRAFSAWRGEPSTMRDLQRAATIGIAAVLAHSAADYPLRTVTMATLFALCCALLEIAPPARSSRGRAAASPQHREGSLAEAVLRSGS